MSAVGCLITIIKRRDETVFAEFFKKNDINQSYSIPCNGTVKEVVLNTLGLEQTKKTAFFSITTKSSAKKIIKSLIRDMHIDLPDMGIAMFVPISSIGGITAAKKLLGDNIPEKEEEKDMFEHEIIVAVAKKGHTDEVMNAARNAGAVGGTVLHAKGTVSPDAARFFNVSIADEKEVIFIVSTSAERNNIMRSIMEKAGSGTEAGAVVFSLPVTDIGGIKFYDKEGE